VPEQTGLRLWKAAGVDDLAQRLFEKFKILLFSRGCFRGPAIVAQTSGVWFSFCSRLGDPCHIALPFPNKFKKFLKFEQGFSAAQRILGA
jgi:hypothetical protein